MGVSIFMKTEVRRVPCEQKLDMWLVTPSSVGNSNNRELRLGQRTIEIDVGSKWATAKIESPSRLNWVEVGNSNNRQLRLGQLMLGRSWEQEKSYGWVN